jgi:hypothetical protein
MRGELLSPYRPARDAVRAILDAPPGSWHAECREKARQRVSDHVALRDADPAERTRLKAAQAARNAENLSRLGQGIRQVLSKGTGGASTTLTALAGRVRGAAAQNDPDVQRSELANIAEALEALGSHMTQSVRLPTSETVADDPAGGRDTACAALPEPAMDIVR